MKHEWLNYKNWALVGASDNPNRTSYKIMKRLLNNGYKVYLITPNHDEIEGIKTYKTLMEVDAHIDVVDFVVNPSIGIHVLEDCRTKGIDKIILQPGTSNDEIVSQAKQYNIEAIDACILVLLSYAGAND